MSGEARGTPARRQRWRFYRSALGDYMVRYVCMVGSPILGRLLGRLVGLEHVSAVRLHHIRRSDGERDMHDHPADMVSILLTGGYSEFFPLEPSGEDWVVTRGMRSFPQFSVVRRRAEDVHSLVLTRPVWTLVFFGPRRRAWGFLTDEGWVDARVYALANPGPGWDFGRSGEPLPVEPSRPPKTPRPVNPASSVR